MQATERQEMSACSRGRLVRNDSDGSIMQHCKQKRPHQKTTKQFSAKSRSKSNVSFKNFQNSHEVSSHEALSKSLLGPLKKSRSSDSFQLHRVYSGLSMTALVRTASHPVVSESARIGSKFRPRKGLRSRSIIVFNDSDENESVTDEEVDSFTEENKIEPQGALLNGSIKKQEINRHAMNALEETMEESISITSSNKNSQRHLSYKPPSRLRNRVDEDDDCISGKDSKGELGYSSKNGRENNIELDRIASSPIANGLERHGSQFPLQENKIERDNVACENRLGKDYDEDKDVNNHREIYENEGSNALNESIPPGGQETEVLSEKPNSFKKKPPVADVEEYIPDMILSQSTGIERRFDRISRENSMTWINQGESQREHVKPHNQELNNFNYINQDLAASIEEEKFSENNERVDNSNKTDFSTSISSLTSHLNKAASMAHHPKNVVNFHNNSSQYHPKGNGSQEVNSSNGLTDFSNFLQTSEIGSDSRTQQKLWLQRENSIQDLSSQNSHHDHVFLATSVGARRESERISREYTNVRRFSNPLADSLHRVALQQNIEIKKNRKVALNDANNGFLVLDRSRNKSENDGFEYGDKLEVRKQLKKIWNSTAAQFNKIENPLAETSSDILSTHKSAVRGLRTSRTTFSQNQRGLYSLHPTTRAVNKRMEHVSNQQHI